MKRDTASYIELFKYWKQSDFENFGSPYSYLNEMEKNGAGEIFYKASVMEIIPFEENKKIIKLSFISTNPSKLFVKAIYNLLAEHKDEEIKFSSYLNQIDKKWKEIIEGEARYLVSPNRLTSVAQDIQKQKEFNNHLSEYLGVDKVPYTFYSASSVEEFFNIQGFQYHPMMYAESTGGIVLRNNIISANDSEYYPHEVAHLYIKKRTPNIKNYFDEGLATFLGGSGKMSYQDYINLLKTELDQYDFFDIYKQDIFNRSLWKADLPMTYLVAAILCDYGINKLGKDEFLNLVNSEADKGNIIQYLNIKEQELDKVLKEYLRKMP